MSGSRTALAKGTSARDPCVTGATSGGTYASRTTPSRRWSSGSTRTGPEPEAVAGTDEAEEGYDGGTEEDGYADDECMRDTSDSCDGGTRCSAA
ncbi:hypothetical protein GCM10010145_35420 [Streptomyces ruber]|uniref:Uncharacterized protein n=2 Tax=Streptomyces TaxID=1883 RepID=A0A918BEA8_9ACTN|nr:hypothetical protein GCM10010145_35420 [Streptomyces ruber]